MSLWPDIIVGRTYVGTGGGLRGYRCTALRQDQTPFGHKYAYVIWEDKVPDGCPVDENKGSSVRTNLLAIAIQEV